MVSRETRAWDTQDVELLMTIWLKSMEQIKTVLKKSPRFAFFAVYVSDTVLRSRRKMLWDLWTVRQDGR